MSKKIEYVAINEESQEVLVKQFEKSKLVLFLGSAISIWSPSNIPTGQDLRKTIYESLNFNEVLGNDSKLNSHLEEILYRFPFELLMDRCPLRQQIRDLLKNFFKSFQTPNPVHIQLANMLIQGKVDSIITPNYDNCLENAINKYSPSSKYEKISIENHFPITTKKRLIFKIHGSIDDEEDSIVFMMRQEGRLKDWKRILLRQLISGKDVLIIGYSGYDFDICPEIPLAKPNKVFWNFLAKKDITLNAKEVSEKIETIFLIGDMRKLLSQIGFSVDAEFGNDYKKHVEKLKTTLMKEIPEIYRKLWRIKILNSISFNNIVVRETEELIKIAPTPSFLVEVLSEKASALSNAGSYRQAALIYENATVVAQKNKLKRDFKVKSDLAAHSWLANGNRFKYWIWNARAKIATQDSKVNYGVESNEIQSLRDWYRILRKWNLHFLAVTVRKYAHKRIEALGPKIHEQGNWHGINRLQKLAADFDIPLKKIKIIGEYDLKPIELGYHQVAMPIGQMIAYRKSIETSKGSISDETYNYGKYLLKQAIDLGIYAEVWKLAIALDSAFNLQSNHAKEFWIGFNKCEYTMLKRKQYFEDAASKVDYL